MPDRPRRHLLLISLHGLLRGQDPELGRDPDTGGQILYVLELARALARHPLVDQVDLVTRLVQDPAVDATYGRETEILADGATIRRIPCGPPGYIPKEQLWPHLDEFSDNLLRFLRRYGRVPDLVHGHYADAGYVAARLASLLDIPMAFTGHSLGRVKRQRLLDEGKSEKQIEKRYCIARRIEAEELALEHAAFVIASTGQEVEEQYKSYEHYQPRRMLVVPPGVDLGRFEPPSGRWGSASRRALDMVEPFLRDPRRPMVLAISRADPRKNIPRLIHAFAGNSYLRERANLVIVAGNRKRLEDLDEGAQEVVREMLQAIDECDLYGRVAYPRTHDRLDIPRLYRFAARTKGVFVNPALTEPFGLTLLEAAASGLPVVATNDGGPRDIIQRCRNGFLVNALDPVAMGRAMKRAISDGRRWRRLSRAGLSGVRHYTWKAHAARSLRALRAAEPGRSKIRTFYGGKSRLITFDRMVICDIDNTLVGNRAGLQHLLRLLKNAGGRVGFGIATGRSLKLTLQVLEEWDIPTPQLLITSVGSAIRYGRRMVEDRGWEHHINYRWRHDGIRRAMEAIPGVTLQSPAGQSRFKVSYDTDPDRMPPLKDLRTRLRKARLQARLVHSHGKFLDILPLRASKGNAVRYFAVRWGIPVEHCLVAGDSGNDIDMLGGSTLGVVVGNYDPEMDKLRGQPQVYFAKAHHAWGIVEGIEHYQFLAKIRTPEWADQQGEGVRA